MGYEHSQQEFRVGGQFPAGRAGMDIIIMGTGYIQYVRVMG